MSHSCGDQMGEFGLNRIKVILFTLLGFTWLSVLQGCSSGLQTNPGKTTNNDIEIQRTGGFEGYTGLASLPVDLNGQLRNARISLSAPIFPKYIVEGYMTFAFLANYCNELDNDAIILQSEVNSSTPLDSDQIKISYEAIAECAYKEFTSKPYFTPAKVEAEDLCQTQLGQGYKMLTEADVNSIDSEFFDSLPSALAVDVGTRYFDNLYYSLTTYIKGSDGTLKVASLYPGAKQRIYDIEYNGSCASAQCHIEGQWVDVGTTSVQKMDSLSDGIGFTAVTLRCIKK